MTCFGRVGLRTRPKRLKVLDMGLATGGENRAGKSLRFLRELAGLTLAEVAVSAQTSVSYLSKVETGSEQATAQYIGRVTGAIADRMKAAA